MKKRSECRADALFEIGEYASAIQEYSLLLHTQPCARLLGNRSTAYARLFLWSESLADAQQVK